VVTAERVRILVDTNVRLRAIQIDNPFHVDGKRALKSVRRQKRQLCLTPQNVREFWNVCTRPTDYNGLGMSSSGAERHTRFLERYFDVLADAALTYSTWRQLVAAHGVLGVKVHDAWLVAAMRVHGISQILTFNVSDFARYDGIQPVDPRSL
jgi:predicted nucleic acid-binding protein